MTGRQMNIYLREENYLFLKTSISQRKISTFINEAIKEKISNQEKGQMKSLISGYRAMSRNKELKNFSSDLLDESLNKIHE